ncbi:MAG: ABC transporter ATP-binding protein [Ktedonobacteraceae bacterium]
MFKPSVVLTKPGVTISCEREKTPFISMDAITMTYGDGGMPALRDFSVSVGEGEFVAIVGPSGCGKSTFLKLASGLQPPSAGLVSVGGREVRGPLKFVGMAFQNSALLPWRTCVRNVQLPLEIVEPFRSRRRKDAAAHIERASELLRSVGLGSECNRYPWQLSGGMQQRAALCRAIVHEPSLVLLDEPFSALDAFTREELWDLMQTLWMQRGFTAVLVTHDLTEAVFLADKVHVCSSRPGRIIHSQFVPFSRPRTERDRYSREFSEVVFSLRRKVAEARNPASV